MAPTVTHQANVRARGAAPTTAATEQAATSTTSRTSQDFTTITGTPVQLVVHDVSPEDYPADMSLHEVWRGVMTPLRRTLLACGLTPEDADDTLQEVALRAVQNDIPVVSPRALAAWAYTVAMHEVANLHRRRARSRESLNATPYDERAADPRETEQAVEARLACQALLAELPSLRPRERTALAAILEPEQRAGVDPNVLAQRVFRLRAKLERSIRRSVGVLIAPVAWVHRKLSSATPGLVAASWTLPLVVMTVLVHPAVDGMRRTDAPSAAVAVTKHVPPHDTPRPTALATTVRAVARRRAHEATPTATRTPPPTTRLAVTGPMGTGVVAEKHENPDNRLICVNSVPQHGDHTCVDKPPLPPPPTSLTRVR